MTFDIFTAQECKERYARQPDAEMFQALCELTLAREEEMANLLGIAVSRANRLDPVKAHRLYCKGKSDRAIAKALGVAPSTVSRWRKEHGLISNTQKLPDDHRRLRIYREGHSDRECARRAGIALTTWRQWRSKFSLPPNKIEK